MSFFTSYQILLTNELPQKVNSINSINSINSSIKQLNIRFIYKLQPRSSLRTSTPTRHDSIDGSFDRSREVAESRRKSCRNCGLVATFWICRRTEEIHRLWRRAWSVYVHNVVLQKKSFCQTTYLNLLKKSFNNKKNKSFSKFEKKNL